MTQSSRDRGRLASGSRTHQSDPIPADRLKASVAKRRSSGLRDYLINPPCSDSNPAASEGLVDRVCERGASAEAANASPMSPEIGGHAANLPSSPDASGTSAFNATMPRSPWRPSAPRAAGRATSDDAGPLTPALLLRQERGHQAGADGGFRSGRDARAHPPRSQASAASARSGSARARSARRVMRSTQRSESSERSATRCSKFPVPFMRPCGASGEVVHRESIALATPSLLGGRGSTNRRT